MEPAVVAKADALIEALGYIQRFNEKIVVVKLGGSFMDNEDEFRKVLTDVVFMHAVGMRPVVVHGGGKAITERHGKGRPQGAIRPWAAATPMSARWPLPSMC